MVVLQGSRIKLRALEPGDLDFLYKLENDSQIWEISGTVTPYSKYVLRQYLDNAHRDIYEVKQLRLCVTNEAGSTLGLIDLFDFDPRNLRAGIGIVILDKDDRNKGIGTEAISLLTDYAFGTLGLHQVYANVLEDNSASRHLFEKLGFEHTGTKKSWTHVEGGYKDQLLFQKIRP